VDDRRKIEYRLTDKGHDLLPTMIALRQWGEKWESGVPSNPVLVDERDHRPILPISIRAHDGRVLTHHDLCWMNLSDIATADSEEADNSVVKRIASV
uniref:winged helix-turn-helix transcriptional regulator n=1 Tax=Blastomonas sp. TaxID=1909299 RepID=UPI00359379FF